MSDTPTAPESQPQKTWNEYLKAAVEWLGLDPARIYTARIYRGIQDVDLHAPVPSRPTGWNPTVTWTSIEKLTPARGIIEEPAASINASGVTMWTGRVSVPPEDVDAFLAAIGPAPED